MTAMPSYSFSVRRQDYFNALSRDPKKHPIFPSRTLLTERSRGERSRGERSRKKQGPLFQGWCSGAFPQYSFTLFERPKRVEKAAGLVLAAGRSNARFTKPLKTHSSSLHPVAPRAQTLQGLQPLAAVAAQLALNVSGRCGGPGLIICFHAGHSSDVGYFNPIYCRLSLGIDSDFFF